MNTATAMVATAEMSQSEFRELKRLEGVVATGQATFLEVGRALAAIRDKRLYRLKHKTFEAYVEARFDIARSTAYQMIGSAQAVEIVRNCGHCPPANEAQARCLVGLEPEQAKTVWRRASTTNGRVTAANVAKIVEEVTGRPPGALPGERSPELVARIMSGLPQDAPERAALLEEAETEAIAAEEESKPTPEETLQAIIDEGEILCGKLKKKVNPHHPATGRLDAALQKYLDILLSKP